MTQLFAPVPTTCKQVALCYYQNASPYLEKIEVKNISNWNFSRIIFPGQKIIFEAPPEAELEVYSQQNSEQYKRVISCQKLLVKEK